jgi:hypothetical protein
MVIPVTHAVTLGTAGVDVNLAQESGVMRENDELHGAIIVLDGHATPGSVVKFH